MERRFSIDELYQNIISASKVMEMYPGMCVARPEVFKKPHESLLWPEDKLLPGQKYYIIPSSTAKKLKCKCPGKVKVDEPAKGKRQVNVDVDGTAKGKHQGAGEGGEGVTDARILGIQVRKTWMYLFLLQKNIVFQDFQRKSGQEVYPGEVEGGRRHLHPLSRG